MTSKSKYKVAVVGCGRFAEPGHIAYYRMHPQVEFAALCDSREEVAAKMARRYGVPQIFTDYEEMLDTVRPDAVSICTPTFLHPQHVIAAASRGIHVLCEKPMAPTIEDGERMIAACRDAGVVLHVGYHKRCDRGIHHVRDLINSGNYGDCYQAEFVWNGLITYGNVPIVNRAMDLARRAGRSTESFSPGWRTADPRCPGGIFEVICHLIDTALWFFGQPVRVQGQLRTLESGSAKPDHAAILLTAPSGVISYIRMSRHTLSLAEEDYGYFQCSGGNLRYSTTSSRTPFLPARVTTELDTGLFGMRKPVSLPPALTPRAFTHYRKIDNFLRATRGLLDPAESGTAATGEDALAVDRIVAELLRENG